MVDTYLEIVDAALEARTTELSKAYQDTLEQIPDDDEESRVAKSKLKAVVGKLQDEFQAKLRAHEDKLKHGVEVEQEATA